MSPDDLKGNKAPPHRIPISSYWRCQAIDAPRAWYSRNKVFLSGSPNTVMYWSSLVRNHAHSFGENVREEDGVTCVEILKDRGFRVCSPGAFFHADRERESVGVRRIPGFQVRRSGQIN